MLRPGSLLVLTLCTLPARLAAQAPAPPAPSPYPLVNHPAPPDLLPGGPGPEPAPSAPAGGAWEPQLTAFDYRQAELRTQDGRWQIHVRGAVLKDFGGREAEAREALRIIQRLRLTERGVVGRPVPVLEYWLADGGPPQAADEGLRLVPLDLNTLRVEEERGGWCLRDGKRLFFTFGPDRAGAVEALAVIRLHGFKQIGYVGLPNPSMVYFLGNAAGEAPSPYPSPSLVKGAARPLVGGDNPPAAPGPLRPAGLVQGPKPGVATLTMRLDRQLLAVRREQNEWKLYHGGQALANFGPNANLAKEGLGALQFYRCTELCQIGEPPAFVYFLANGQAPRGLKPGLPGQAFQPKEVTARPFGKNWLVCDGDRPLVNFGPNAEAARELAQAIRRHQFDYLCQVGSGEGRSLTILVRSR